MISYKKKRIITAFIIISAVLVSAAVNIQNKTNQENFPVNITIDGFEFRVENTNSDITVGDYLTSLGIRLRVSDTVIPDKNTRLTPSSNIIIKRAKQVQLTYSGKTESYLSSAYSIKDFLDERKIRLNEYDKTIPDINSSIVPRMTITVIRVSKIEEKEKKTIPFPEKIKHDNSLPYGKTIITARGIPGEKVQTFLVTYENGKAASKKMINEKIVKEPKPQTKIVGTKIEIGKTQRGLATWYKYKGGLTAASIAFPKGTYLKVTEANTKRSVVVKVTDYGPELHTGKIIDLEKDAFSKLAPLGRGVINVTVEEIISS